MNPHSPILPYAPPPPAHRVGVVGVIVGLALYVFASFVGMEAGQEVAHRLVFGRTPGPTSAWLYSFGWGVWTILFCLAFARLARHRFGWLWGLIFGLTCVIPGVLFRAIVNLVE